MNNILLLAALAAPQLFDRVAAVVNDQPILFSEVQRRAAPELARMAMQDPDSAEATHRRDDMFRSALQVLIDEALLQEQLKDANAEISDDQLDAAIADVKKQNNIPNDAAFEKALSSEGLTLAAYRAQLKRELEKSKLLNIKVRSQAKVSDDDVKVEYERQYVQVGGEEEIHARHILLALKADAPADQNVALKQRAVELVQRLRAGADFAKLATEMSDGPSASKGGDLGYFKRGVMVGEFENVAFSLPINGISDPIRTQYGWHIIQVLDRRKAPPPPLETVKAAIQAKLQKEQVDRLTADYLAGLRKDGDVQYKMDSLKPVAAHASAAPVPPPKP